MAQPGMQCINVALTEWEVDAILQMLEAVPVVGTENMQRVLSLRSKLLTAKISDGEDDG